MRTANKKIITRGPHSNPFIPTKLTKGGGCTPATGGRNIIDCNWPVDICTGCPAPPLRTPIKRNNNKKNRTEKVRDYTYTAEKCFLIKYRPCTNYRRILRLLLNLLKHNARVISLNPPRAPPCTRGVVGLIRRSNNEQKRASISATHVREHTYAYYTTTTIVVVVGDIYTIRRLN